MAVPLLEIVVILRVGELIGVWWTVLLLVADSIAGAWLLRIEGRRAWTQFRTALADGRWPGDEVAQGALVIVGGTLLLTPGFVTDLVGFALLLGPTRRLVSRTLRGRVSAVGRPGADAGSGPSRRRARGRPGRAGRAGGRRPDGYDVEVVEIRREQRDPDEPGSGPPAPPSGR